MITRKQINPLLVAVMLLVFFLTSSCSGGPDPTPTLSLDQIQTQAVATYAVGLTQTAAALPTHTPTLTPTTTATPTLTPSPTAQATAFQFFPTSSCYALAFIKDITIPDNTRLKPEEKFTKTWRVQNNGTCSWEEGFKFKLISGNAMGGTSYTVNKEIKPGAELEISIEMTAPKTVGFYTGNWRMANEDGVIFGDNVYVLIEVAAPGATKTPAAATATAIPSTATQTITPPTETETSE